MSENGIQPEDVVIRRTVGLSMQGEGTRDIFTLHRHPTNEKIGGPWDSQQFARDRALAMAKQDGCDVWLETGPDSKQFQRISS